MKGWVYIITNPAMPGLIKVGYSMKDPEIRASELGHTGSPLRYVVEYEALLDNPRDTEQSVHFRLRHCREGKEWFRCSVENGIVALKEVAGANIRLENFKQADRLKAEELQRQKREADATRLSQERAAVAARNQRQADLKRRLTECNHELQRFSGGDPFVPTIFSIVASGAVCVLLFLAGADARVGWFVIFAAIITPTILAIRKSKAAANSDEYRRLIALHTSLERQLKE